MSLRRKFLVLSVLCVAVIALQLATAEPMWRFESLDQPDGCYQDCSAFCDAKGSEYVDSCRSACGGSFNWMGCGLEGDDLPARSNGCYLNCDCGNRAT